MTTYGYKTDIVDVSQVVLIENYEQYSNDNAIVDLDGMTTAERSRELQRRGNYLRENGGIDFIARMTFLDVIWEDLRDRDECEGGRLGERRAYIVDSFKHPEEALFFRNVFGDAFYLIAVVADEHIRKSRLIERKNYSEKEYEDIADRDAGEDFESGQHAIETIVEADYFFENNFHTKDQISKEAERFLRLVFRTSLDSPRKDEEGMALAFQAALKSACLSRQVGASIFSATGQIIATGCNDVPRFGGGLYTTESTPGDKRCWVHGAKCYNDNEKDVIVQGIISAVGDGLDGADELDDRARTICAEIVGRAVQSSRVKRLLEFSRSIHAEMDALISVARNGQEGIVGSTLYCTTYPCHNCAKHIVGAGVRRVVYLEPYEKSLARKLHSDSIADPSQDSCHEKLAIDVYTGVSPGRYHQLFSSKGMERKDSGRFLDNDRQRVLLVPICAQTIAETSARLKLHLPTN